MSPVSLPRRQDLRTRYVPRFPALRRVAAVGGAIRRVDSEVPPERIMFRVYRALLFEAVGLKQAC
jgi:hypothetical protein